MLRKPTEKSFLKLIQQSTYGIIKGLIIDDQIFLWDAHKADHSDIIFKYFGKDFEIDVNKVRAFRFIDEGDMTLSGEYDMHIKELSFLQNFKFYNYTKES